MSCSLKLKVNSYAYVQEKESLISELRKELRVSDEEHRELLNKVNDDGAIRRMRSLLTGSISFFSEHVLLTRPYSYLIVYYS